MTTLQDTPSPLLQSVLTGSAEGMPSLQDLLAQLAAANPTAAVVLQYMTQQRAAAAQAEAAAGDAGEDAAAGPDEAPRQVGEASEASAARAGEALRSLRRRLEALYSELEELRGRNDDLAAALGACARCWGEDPSCSICEGLGRPGGAPPDAYLYARMVAPAARRLNYWDPADGRLPGAPPLRTEIAPVPEERRPE